MTSPPLDDLCGPDGPLKREPPDRAEYEGLIRSGEARLRDAQRSVLSLESRFDLAYLASHTLCLAALRRAGYRPSRQRYVVFQAIPETLGLGPEVWRILARGHDIRKLADYEGQFSASERLVSEIIEACEQVLEALRKLGPIRPRPA